MARGYPDFTRDAIIRGVDPTGTLKIVAVDEVGRIQGVFYGQDYTSQTLKILGVDADGNIIARITGQDEAGELKTVLTDSDGRLQAVALGKNYQQNILQPIGVDQNGYLSAILKGQYGSELKTAAVDEQGRLIVISSDYFEAFGEVYRLSLSTVADRLTAKNTIYPVGTILVYEDFEGKLHKGFQTGGYKVTVSLSSEQAWFGSRSLKMKFESDPSARGNLNITHAYVNASVYSYEVSFYAPEGLNSITIGAYFFDGPYSKGAIVTYYFYNYNLTLIDENLNEITFGTGIQIPQNKQFWRHMCLKLDWLNKRYKRFYFDNRVYDISSYKMFYPAGTENSQIQAFVVVRPSTSTYGDVYLDKFVIGVE